MKLKRSKRTAAVTLRRRAKKLPPGQPSLPQELQKRRIELEAQKKQLRQAQVTIAAERQKFANLYDLAPVGYFTLTANGTIRHLNPAGTRLLGGERSGLLQRRFTLFIAETDRPAFHAFLEQVFQSRRKPFCEITLQPKRQPSRFVRLEAAILQNSQECLVVAMDLTEHQRAEQALQEINQLHQQIITDAHEGIILYDRDLRYRIWNPFMEKISGLSAKDILGRHPLEVFPFLKNAGVIHRLKRALAGDTPRPLDFPYTLPDKGISGWLSDTSAPLRNANQEIIGVVGLVRDITERKRAEQELQIFQQAIENSLDAIGISTPEGHHYYQNKAFSKLFGLPVDLIDGAKGSASAVYADEKVGQEVFSTIMRGEVWMGEVVMLDKNRQAFEVSLRAYAIKNEAGKVIGLAGVHRDIRERKQTEKALRASESILRAVVDNIPFELWARDGEGWCFLENAVCHQHWGDLVGQRPEDAKATPEELALWQANNRRAMAGEVVREDVQYIVNGEKRFFHNLVAPIRIGQKIQGILGFNIDITDRKKAEEDMRQLSCQLLQSQDDERRRIGRELHDTTAQHLVGMLFDLSALKKQLFAQGVDGHKVLEESIAVTKRCIDEIRTLSFLLHPPQLGHFGFLGAVRDVAEAFGRRSGIKITVQLPRQLKRLAPEKELALLKILQEALWNVHRHSGSQTATVSLRHKDGEIHLAIADAGRGLNVNMADGHKQSATPLGVGINGMRERLRYLNGRLEIQTGPVGSTFTAVVPLAIAAPR